MTGSYTTAAIKTSATGIAFAASVREQEALEVVIPQESFFSATSHTLRQYRVLFDIF